MQSALNDEVAARQAQLGTNDAAIAALERKVAETRE
jgi:hypothetical protein